MSLQVVLWVLVNAAIVLGMLWLVSWSARPVARMPECEEPGPGGARCWAPPGHYPPHVGPRPAVATDPPEAVLNLQTRSGCWRQRVMVTWQEPEDEAPWEEPEEPEDGLEGACWCHDASPCPVELQEGSYGR